MKRFVVASVVSGAALFFGLALHAQDAKKGPSPENKKLDFLLGDWTVEEHMHPCKDWPAAESKGKMVTRRVLGDQFVSEELDSTALGGLKAKDFFGWNAEKKGYEFAWFDSTGDTYRLSGGKWTDDKTLVFEASPGTNESIFATMRHRFVVESPTKVTLHKEKDYKDGKGAIETFTINYTKS